MKRGQKRWWALVVSVVLLAMVAACTTPRAEVRNVELRSLSLTQLDLQVLLEFFNPNDFALPLEQIQWNLALFDRPVADGVATPEASIPAQGSERVSLPLSVGLQQLGQAAAPIFQSDEIPWQIEGRCYFETPVGPIGVDFARRGQWANPLR